MSKADPLVSDERLEEIRLHVERGCSCTANVASELIPEVDRLREHNAYLTDLFYGITRFFAHLCPKHDAIPLAERDLSRIVVPACRGCQEDDLRALVDGNIEATTLARQAKESSASNIRLMIENHRLRERLGEAEEPAQTLPSLDPRCKVCRRSTTERTVYSAPHGGQVHPSHGQREGQES